jgi:hypothetical protein
MTTSAWVSITDFVARNDCNVTALDGAGILIAEFTRKVVGLPENGPVNAITRWALVIREDHLLRLQWQACTRKAALFSVTRPFK